jgi:WD40 repeat protein
MDQEEAIAALCAGLPDEILQPAYRPQIEALVTRLNCWPLLVTLARGMLHSQLHYGRGPGPSLHMLEYAYQTRGILAFDLSNENERERAAGACLETSLRHMEEFTSQRYHPVERYQELAIFPEDTDIPLTSLQRFWKGMGKLEAWETEDLCMRLHQLSLLLTCDLGTGTIRLHDVMRNYLLHRVGPDLSGLHARFLDMSQQEQGLKRWADLPAADLYLWQYLIWHLCHAGLRAALTATLTDLLYLTRKAFYMDVAGLEADCFLASTSFPVEETASAPSFFPSLHRSIMGISHLLRQARTETEMGGLLLSHFGWEPVFIGQRAGLERELPRPLLTAWYPLPAGSSSALLRTLQGHTARVAGCAVSPDGRFIVSASWDHMLKLWDAATGAERLSLTGHTGGVNACAVSLDGRFLISASWDHTLKLWDASTGAERLSLTGHTNWVTACAVSPDGSFLVSASSDHTLKVWDAATAAKHLSLTGYTSGVTSCAVSPDGRFLVSAPSDYTLKLWDAATGAERLSLTGHTSVLTGCAVSPDGRFIVSASSDYTLNRWDAATGAERLSLTGHTGDVTACAVSPDGRFIVSASWGHTLKLWDAVTGAERLSLIGHTRGVTGCAVSPDGHFIVSSSVDKTLKLWDAATGAERLSLTGHTNWVTACAVSPDGRFLVSASLDKTLKLWEAWTGQCVLTFPVDGELSGCVVSPDGEHLVACGAQGMFFLRLLV